jgi:hypothetical protein
VRTGTSLRRALRARRSAAALLATGSLVLAGGWLLPSSAALATAAHRPYFVIWKPGTALPAVPSGFKLEAWPSGQAMRHIKVGQRLAMTSITAASARRANVYRRLENTAGLVNLMLVPDGRDGPLDCIPLPAVLQSKVGSEPTNVMQSYSTNSSVTQTFTYGNGQSSDVGVGYSTSGAQGTFTASGGWSVSTTDSQSFDPQTGRSYNHWETYFEVGLFYVGNTCPGWGAYEVFPYQWNAGTKYVHPSGPPGTPYCTPEHPGDGFTQSTTSAATFTVGYNTPADVGFSGTAQTGWDTTAEISFAYSRTGQGGQLCGLNNTPPNNPGVIVAAN